MNPVFTPDAKVAKVAETYALDAINLAAKAFQTKFDFSVASIAQRRELENGTSTSYRNSMARSS